MGSERLGLRDLTVFASPFLFLRDPHGGVEDLAAIKAAGFAAVFCNVGDFPPDEWEAIVRPRALALGMPCGPWLRVQDEDGQFDDARLDLLVSIGDAWEAPLIVNAEAELKGSGATLTKRIADTVRGRDAAVSMEPQPFADVEWWPLADVPMLPQIFGADVAAVLGWLIEQWHAYGIRCVYPTFGAYNGSPATYPLDAPYSLFAGDDCGGNYAAWSPRSYGYQGCTDDGGGDVAIGRGAAASANDAWVAWQEITAKPDAWRLSNPREWQAIQDYERAAPGTEAPTTIRTATGRMLLSIVEARRYADGTHA